MTVLGVGLIRSVVNSGFETCSRQLAVVLYPHVNPLKDKNEPKPRPNRIIYIYTYIHTQTPKVVGVSGFGV